MLRARNPTMTILLARIIPTSVASTNTRIEALNREIAGLQSLSTPQSPVVIVDQYSGYNGQADNQVGGVHPLTSGEKKMAARWEGALLPVLDRVAPPEFIRYGPHAVPGRIEAEDYDVGGYSTRRRATPAVCTGTTTSTSSTRRRRGRTRSGGSGTGSRSRIRRTSPRAGRSR